MKKELTEADVSAMLVEELRRTGYCIVRNEAIARVHALAKDLDPIFDATPFCDGNFYGRRTKRFGSLLKRQDQVEDGARIDLAAVDEIDHRGQVLAHGRRPAEHVDLRTKHAVHVQGDAVRNTHEGQVATGAHAAKGLVTIMGAKGNKVTLKVKDTQTLAEIKTGDQIEGTYIQALAVAVLPKPAAK